ncbi:MAG: phosphoribosylamine--glycine ligase [Acidimicrobiia bacterium]
MIVLVLGSGGREHALVWELARDASVDEVHVAPGNPGMECVAQRHAIDPADPASVVALAAHLNADLVIIGPEAPLVAGVADALRAAGRAVFGPNADGAELEGSKAFMKDVLVGAGVPTARHETFRVGVGDTLVTELARADTFLQTLPGLYVIKTDGLAAGKGVIVTESLAEARTAVRAYLDGSAFGDAGRTCVIEEGMTGPECSLLVLCDGQRALPLAPAQDFKRIFDGDRGPNTGGMGAYSPLPFIDDALIASMMEDAVVPTIAELRRRGIDYRGVLYAGLMLTPEGPKMLEYNVRFGDPECQVIVPRLTSSLATHCMEVAQGALTTTPKFSEAAGVTVVLASRGYPATSSSGDVIAGLNAAGSLDDSEAIVFHAGTDRTEAGEWVTAGGRVLTVTALGPDLRIARDTTYAALDQITFDGKQCRLDIAAEHIS